MQDVTLEELDTPIGKLVIAVKDGAALLVEFDHDEDSARARCEGLLGEEVRFRPVRRTETGKKISRYFRGDLAALDEIETVPVGTPFQRKVWRALREIPCGETCSYGALAKKIGLGGRGARAVGLANGDNPTAVVVPCHRVIAADGTLCGYGGGLPRKEWLLRHEKALLV